MVYEIVADHSKIVPHEVIEKYGDMRDWRNTCGTGPYMLVDHVSGGSLTYEKNPTTGALTRYTLKQVTVP